MMPPLDRCLAIVSLVLAGLGAISAALAGVDVSQTATAEIFAGGVLDVELGPEPQ